MSFWDGLDAAARSFQGGVNFSHNAIRQGIETREAADTRRQQAIESQVMQEQQAPQPPRQTALPAPATTTVGDAPAAPAPAPAPEAPEQEDVIARATRGLGEQIYFPRGATGPTTNADAIRDTVTGRGMLAPEIQERAIRNASGNKEGPLTRRDTMAYMDAVSQRLTSQGLGHRVEAFQARVMQNLQSSASRTMALAAAAAQGGDMEQAARLAVRAYGFIPDGGSARVERDGQGNFVAVRTDENGQPMGDPVPLNPQTLREMAIAVANPGAMEELILKREDRTRQRDELNERIRHNRASEALMGQRIAAAGARGGRGQPTNPATLADAAEAAKQVDPFVDAALEGLTGAGGRALDRVAVADLASEQYLYNFRNGVSPQVAATAAARMSAGHIGNGEGQVRVGRDDTTGAVFAQVNGVTFPLVGRLSVLADQHLRALGSLPPAAPVAPAQTGVSPRGNRPAPAPPVARTE